MLKNIYKYLFPAVLLLAFAFPVFPAESVAQAESSGSKVIIAQLPSSSSPTTTSTGKINFPSTGLPDPAGGIKAILENLLRWMLGAVGVIALISFVVSGIQYFIAAGDSSSMETAKKNMTYSIIGVIVALSGFVIIQAVDTALRGASTAF